MIAFAGVCAESGLCPCALLCSVARVPALVLFVHYCAELDPFEVFVVHQSCQGSLSMCTLKNRLVT